VSNALLVGILYRQLGRLETSLERLAERFDRLQPIPKEGTMSTTWLAQNLSTGAKEFHLVTTDCAPGESDADLLARHSAAVAADLAGNWPLAR